MCLDVLELAVHECLHLWSGRQVLAEKWWVLLECVSFDLANDASTFRDVFLELSAGVLIEFKVGDRASTSNHTALEGHVVFAIFQCCILHGTRRDSRSTLGRVKFHESD